MMTSDPIVAAADAVDELRTYLRIDCADDDPLIAAMIAAAVASCEAFLGELLLARGVTETLDGSTRWTPLSAVPVRAITSVTRAGEEDALAAEDYAIDIDRFGTGQIRLTGAAGRIAIAYSAGRAIGWAAIEEPLRHGIVRLAALRYGARDRDVPSAPGADIVALWRGARRMRLA